VPYEQAQAIAERIGGWHVAVATLWQPTQTHGQRLLETTEHAQQQVNLETTRWENQRYSVPKRFVNQGNTKRTWPNQSPNDPGSGRNSL
jgi:hypothetical protein